MALKKSILAKSAEPAEPVNQADFAFEKQNYLLLILGVVLIIVGFLLMLGGGSDDPAVFNYDMFNFQRMTLAPILIIGGFVVEIFAIMWKPKQK
jgi:hypothetical protein